MGIDKKLWLLNTGGCMIEFKFKSLDGDWTKICGMTV